MQCGFSILRITQEWFHGSGLVLLRLSETPRCTSTEVLLRYEVKFQKVFVYMRREMDASSDKNFPGMRWNFCELYPFIPSSVLGSRCYSHVGGWELQPGEME